MKVFRTWLGLYWIKALVGLVIAIIAIAFTPFFLNILTSVATVVGFLVILYFWLLDDSVEEEYIDSGAPSLGGDYNYATGEVDSGLELGGQYDG